LELTVFLELRKFNAEKNGPAAPGSRKEPQLSCDVGNKGAGWEGGVKIKKSG